VQELIQHQPGSQKQRSIGHEQELHLRRRKAADR